MRRVFLTALLMATAMAGSQTTGNSLEVKLRIVSLTRVVRIPLTTFSGEMHAAESDANFPGLAVFRGGEDETPEGPGSFDVFADGSFLITDPLLGRLSQFNSEGRFKRSWQLGFAAESVNIRPDQTVEVREARTSAVYVLDQKGALHPSESGPSISSAKVASPHMIVVSRGAGDGGSSSQINVQLDRPGFTLLSLELLGSEDDRGIFVALESTQGTQADEGISVNKNVRRYSADGKLLSQTDDMPLDYYVTPVDELRVQKGIVYQLMTTPSEAHINVWNMN